MPRIGKATLARWDSKWNPQAIKSLRRRLTLSQADLAHELGIDRVTVYLWERGECRPSGSCNRLLDMIDAQAYRADGVGGQLADPSSPYGDAQKPNPASE